ncbi:MAG: c-type cytochrome [Balneolaceae bacterium]
MMKAIYSVILVVFLFAALTGCSDNPAAGEPEEELPEEELPSSDLSFSEHILPIFNNNCRNCHIGQAQNGVMLDSYTNVMESVGDQYKTEIVKAGSPDESPLVDKIESDPEIGGRMPQGGSLSNDQIQAIRTWIEEGAENN